MTIVHYTIDTLEDSSLMVKGFNFHKVSMELENIIMPSYLRNAIINTLITKYLMISCRGMTIEMTIEEKMIMDMDGVLLPENALTLGD